MAYLNFHCRSCLNVNIYSRACLNVNIDFRACLNLITDTLEAVQNEVDLIQSLALIDGFGVSILPIQGQSHFQGR